MIQNFHLNEIPKDNLQNTREREIFISRVTRMLKSSYEYKKYEKYLDISTRGTFPKIEQHFTPFSLNDVAEMILCKLETNDKLIIEFVISKELMDLLYGRLIPHCFISYSDHYAIHFDKKDDYIYSEKEFEQFRPFIEEYLEYMSDEYKERLNICIGKMKGMRTLEQKKKELIDIMYSKRYHLFSDIANMKTDRRILTLLTKKTSNNICKQLASSGKCPKYIKKDLNILCSVDGNANKCLTSEIENCWRNYLKDDFEKDVKIDES